jgi:CubicO group peptidase (beta-lactamase class C family)
VVCGFVGRRARVRQLVLGLLALVSVAGSDGAPTAPDAILVRQVDAVVERAMANGLIAGAVVATGNRAGLVLEKAYGRRWGTPQSGVLEAAGVFDLASLTKVIATAPAVMRLAEEGRLGLGDTLGAWFPELQGTSAAELRVRDLLTHTSGLRDFDLPGKGALEAALRGVAAQGTKGLSKGRFRYADINFILLGELVRRASGETLDRYARESFYAPLGMDDTGFLPSAEVLGRCVPTAGAGGSPVLGQVQDPLARRLGGVAGHAGLFSSARDLARFCRMLLGRGELDGRRVLSEAAVRLMVAPRPCGEGAVRSLGWDVSSAYSSPRSEAFASCSFGHTGYTGVSVWIDPTLDTFVILLSSRLEYRRTREFNRLRAELSAAAAGIAAARHALRPAGEGGG